MRDLTETLKAAQKWPLITPLYKIVLTHGENSYTYELDRILDLRHSEEDDRQNAEVLLDNWDDALTNLDLKGYQGVISYGITTSAGEEYSATAPLKVIAQQSHSTNAEPRQLFCNLGLAGYPNQIAEDKANDKYVPDEDNTDTVKTLVRKLFGDSGVSILAVYDHCDSYDVVFDSEDSLIDTFQPKDSFYILEGDSRWAKIKELLKWTQCVIRFEDDGLPHIRKPTISGETYDAEYSLAEGEQPFLNKTYRKRLVIPNYIVVRSLASQETPYSGYAEDEASSALMKKVQHHRMRVSSNAQCTAIATAILSHYQRDAEGGHGLLPIMDVGAEVHDYVKITDSRQGDSVVGNIGYLNRHANPEQKIFKIEFRFGAPDMAGLMGTAPPSLSGTGGAGAPIDLSEIIAAIQQLFGLYESLAEMIRAIQAYLDWWRKYIFIDDVGNIVLRAESGQWVQIFNDLSLTCNKNFGMMLSSVACRLFWYTKAGTLDHVFCPEVDGTGKIGDNLYAFLEGRFKKMYAATELYIPSEAA